MDPYGSLSVLLIIIPIGILLIIFPIRIIGAKDSTRSRKYFEYTIGLIKMTTEILHYVILFQTISLNVRAIVTEQLVSTPCNPHLLWSERKKKIVNKK